ncbi:MAG: HK97 gp10 family phage protein [Candidatus Bathyarchaeia archaeon]
MSITLRMEWSTAMKRLCERGASQTRGAILQALRQAEAQALGEAQRLVPVRTGRLRGSIYARVDEASLAMVLGSDLSYAAAVEYGTSRTEPRPYLTPAVEAALTALRSLRVKP